MLNLKSNVSMKVLEIQGQQNNRNLYNHIKDEKT